MPKKIFISHATADDNFVSHLRKALESQGMEVWIDSQNLRGGDTLKTEIESAIKDASAFIVVISEKVFRTRWVKKEVSFALKVLQPQNIPIVPILIDGLPSDVLDFFFDDEPVAIPIKNNLQESMPQILAALGKELPTEVDLEIAIDDNPLEELVLKLTDPGIQEIEGKRRAIATAKLIYKSSATRDIESKRFSFTAPLGHIELNDLEWYLERYAIWPIGVFQKRAARIEDQFPKWGKSLFDAAMPSLCHHVLEGWNKINENADRRFSVLVDDELPDGAQTDQQRQTKQAATLLLALPWELLHDGTSYVMMGAKPLTVRRQLVNRIAFDIYAADPPVRVLLVSPRPEDAKASYIDHRASAIPLVHALDSLGNQAELTILSPPTFAALERELSNARKADKPFHVVHFDGHGVYRKDIGLGGLCFESSEPVLAFHKRKSAIVNADKIAEIMRDHRIPLVFLEACQTAAAEIDPATSVAAALLDNGIASVVAMTHSVLVVTAQKFVTEFYQALVKGERVGSCMTAGQMALKLEPDRGSIFGAGKLELQDWFVPILLQEKEDPRLFKRLPSASMKAIQKNQRQKQMGQLPDPPNHSFVGRSRELLSLERLLSEQSVAVIQGEGGEGKTTLAVELARWLVLTARMDQAVFVSVERNPDIRAMIDRMGQQLVSNYAVAEYGQDIWGAALQPVDRKLKENRTVIVFDNMESILPTMQGFMTVDPQIIQDVVQLSQHLLNIGSTCIIFTSREPLPPPFDKQSQICHLGRLSTTDAIQLVKEAMKQAQLMPKEMPDGSPDPDVERLVTSVNCHARSLVLLAPHVHKLGVDQTGDALNQLMAELHAQYPDDRERSLYVSVVLSLRRLPEDVRQAVDLLAVFHGGVNARVWWSDLSFQTLQTELTRTGLAQPYPHDHMRLHPALAPYLKTRLSSAHMAKAQEKWAQGMKSLAVFLYKQKFENTKLSAELTVLELPNLMALLDYTQQREDAEAIVDIAGRIENLLQNLGRRQILQQVVAVREKVEKGLKAWNNTSFNAARNKINRLLEKGSLGPAQTAAQDLLKKALDAGEDAYPESAYNIAMANLLLGRILSMSGDSDPALTYLESARTQFDRLGRDGDKDAQRMASACLTEQGGCLRNLGRLDEAAAAYEESIALDEKLGDLRGAAVGKGQLGTVRYVQKQYAEALSAYESAIQSFESLGEPSTVAIYLHQMGMVHEASNNYPAAETAYRKALGIRVQQNNKDGEADSLLQLGNLFDKMGQLEDAVTFYRQAADIYVALGDLADEGLARNNLADTFIKLKRYDDARQEILRAIECKKPFGHTALPWTAWQILSTIEQAQDNATAAKDARDQAVALYMAFRRSGGGKYEYGAQLCAMVGDAIQRGARAEVEAAFGQFGEGWQPLIDALRQILDGVRDVQVVEGLNFMHEVDVRLLLKSLESTGDLKNTERSMNPYNYIKPVDTKHFIGRWDIVNEIIDNISRDSFCIINGGRFGKTSLLKAIESTMLSIAQVSENVISMPCFVDLKDCDKESEDNIFAHIIGSLFNTLSKLKFPQVNLSNTLLKKHIESKINKLTLLEFEKTVNDLKQYFERTGKQFILVILFEEPERIISLEWSNKLFDSLRTFIYTGSLSNTVRLIMTTTPNIFHKLKKSSPLIDILIIKHLALLSKKDIKVLINLSGDVSEDVFKEIQHQSGGHPFIIQYILHHLWQKNKHFEETKPEKIRDIADQMIHERDADFRNWFEKIGHGGRKAYSMIANSKNGMDESSLRANLLDHVDNPLDDLMSLRNSGLVIKDDQKRYRIAPHLFFNWFNEFIMPKIQPLNQSVPFYISSVVLKNIQSFNDFSTQFTHAEKATCLCSLFLGDNSAGKTSLLRSIVLGLCSENSSKMLLNHYQGMLVQKGQSQGSIKISLHHKENGTYIIESLIKRINENEEQLTRKYYKDSEQNEISPENFPKQDLFVCGYGAGRTQGDLSIDKVQHYSIFNAVGTLFNYNSPLKGPELSLRRLIDEIKSMNNASNGAAESDSLARDKTVSIFQQAIENIFMFKDNEQLVLSAKGIEIIAQDGQTIPLHAHGDGYQNTAAWILDMISWSMSANRDIAPDKMSGIVIIDEIEQHLHPKWQRHLIQKLREQFPKIQFILTTHSPLCSSGAETSLRQSSTLIKKLNKTENGIECTDVHNIDGLKADQVLESKAFELESTLNPEINKLYEEFAQMYIDDREDETRFIELQQILEEKLPKLDFEISSMRLDRQKIMQKF